MAAPEEDESDFFGLCRKLWRHKFIVIAGGLIGGGIAVAMALTATPIFRAEALVTDAKDGNMNATSSLASQFSGLASIAGVNIGSAGASDQEAQAVLDSRYLAEEFIKRNKLMPLLFSKSKKPPTLWQAVEDFKNGVLTVRRDLRKGTTTVGVEWTDAVTAARWANGVVALANELIRARALDESTRNIAYLNQEIARTNVVELRKVMFNIIESETKTLMLANGRTEYAFQVVDPAVAPDVRIRPQRTHMVLVGGALGGFAGVLGALAMDMYQRRRRLVGSVS